MRNVIFLKPQSRNKNVAYLSCHIQFISLVDLSIETRIKIKLKHLILVLA